MRWWIMVGVLVAIGFLGWWVWGLKAGLSPMGVKKEPKERIYEKYDFDSLRTRRKLTHSGGQAEIEFLGRIKEVETRRKLAHSGGQGRERIYAFRTEKFSFVSQGKKITGMMNWSGQTRGSARTPAIIMIRGYVDREGYYTGSGTWKVADELAASTSADKSNAAGAGYVTVSLDFLGFGGSDEESTDILEARFVKVVNVLDLIELVKQLDFVDPEKIGIWAHSNGGQIALSVLEVSGENYPTVLWAPMTNPFPQSVLETITDDEGGRYVKQKIDEFLKEYDPRRFAFENYYGWIKAPVLVQQGTADEWCRVEWQEEVVKGINEKGGRAELVVYRGDDHNLSKRWEEAVEKSKEWYKRR